MLVSAETEPVSSPALALRASLVASGLLQRGGAEGAASRGDGWSSAQAVHQGDRLLRAVRTLLHTHAQAHGDHCALWVADGADMVVVLCEQPPGWSTTAGAGFVPGDRQPTRRGAFCHLHPTAAASGGRRTDEQSVWTSAMSPGPAHDWAGKRPGGMDALVLSVVPWAHWPVVLSTIAGAADGPGQADDEARAEHLRRHRWLGSCLAWSLEAVIP